MGAHVRAGDLDIWAEQVGEGPDVLLIAGAGDSVEVWQYQLDGLADRYRITAFDNRGVGRTRMPADPVTVERWPTTPSACWTRSGFRRPTWPATREAA